MPNQKILRKYADVLIKYALNSGKGIKKGDVVFLRIQESARDFLPFLMDSVLEAGGHYIIDYVPDGIKRILFEKGDKEQLDYYPEIIDKARINLIDHYVRILSNPQPHELDGIDTKSIMSRFIKENKVMRIERLKKEDAGKLTWTAALYPTSGAAKEARLTLKEYWDQVIKACFLDKKHPIKEWEKVFEAQKRIRKKLDDMKIQHAEIKGPKVDLKVKIGEKRRWIGGSGNNIPSFEIFTSPDWRGTEGWVEFEQPLYRHGNLIEGIRLEFEKGKVVKATAQKNQKLLLEMLETENMDKVGEFSLTDKRFSHIDKFMAETLYDENVGGPYGNFHIALGLAFKNCFTVDAKTTKSAEWKKLGLNESQDHVDIISTGKRTVTAVMEDGTRKIIYKDGEFLI